MVERESERGEKEGERALNNENFSNGKITVRSTLKISAIRRRSKITTTTTTKSHLVLSSSGRRLQHVIIVVLVCIMYCIVSEDSAVVLVHYVTAKWFTMY